MIQSNLLTSSPPSLEESTLLSHSLTTASSRITPAPRYTFHRMLPVIPSAFPGQPSLIPNDSSITQYVVITHEGVGVDLAENLSVHNDARTKSRASSVMLDLTGDHPSFHEDSFYQSTSRPHRSSHHHTHSHFSQSSHRRRRNRANESVGEQVQEFSDESRTVEGLSESTSVVDETVPFLSRRVWFVC